MFTFLKVYSSRVGVLVVVHNGAIIENQSSVCLVMTKNIIVNGLRLGKVFRQKQCHPALQHCLMLLESASCKNSETSCLESERKLLKVQWSEKKLISNILPQLHNIHLQLQANIIDTAKYFNMQHLKRSNA